MNASTRRQPLPEIDERSNYQFDRDECQGAARFVGTVITIVAVGILAGALAIATPARGQTAAWGQECDNCTQQQTGRPSLGVSPSWSSIRSFVENGFRGGRKLRDDARRAVMYSRFPQIAGGAGYPGHPSGSRSNVNRCGNCGGGR